MIDGPASDRHGLIVAIARYRLVRNLVRTLIAATAVLALAATVFPPLRPDTEWTVRIILLLALIIALLITLVHVLRHNAITLGAADPDTWPSERT